MPGIDRLSFYVPKYYLDMKTLASERGIDPGKFYIGIGQEAMSISPPDEDVVTMAANAALQCLEGEDNQTIRSLIFATESGIDQSKAAGIYVHSLLGLPSTCQVFEVKQACCSSTMALYAALDRVARRPEQKVLVIASDIARYGIGTAGEPTQGAGAVAMLVSAKPRLVDIMPQSGSFTEDVMDFWRPNYLDEALVDGKFSIRMYLKALTHAWNDFQNDGGAPFAELSRFCYHQPFTKMAHKAHRALRNLANDDQEFHNSILETGLRYNRRIGNTYTASLYINLCSLLEQEKDDLTHDKVGMFSYGSGCVGTYFHGAVRPGYHKHHFGDIHEAMLDDRIELTYDEYTSFYEHQLPIDGSAYSIDAYETGAFRLAGIQEHQRCYERSAACAAALKKLHGAA